MNKIHFIGIGGIGVSALARYYLARGFKVSGSDMAESQILSDLRKLGVKIPPNPPFLKGGADGVDLVVYSAAVQENNPELIEARRLGIKCQTYAQALGELTKKMWTIAISGTHGKSTTTAMIGLILEAAGLDPTVIVGTKIKEWNYSNCRVGKSKYLVIEADEYAASFLNYWPKIIVLTNIEEDHLDYYTGGLEQIKKTFAEYVSHLGSDGILAVNEEDGNIREIVQSLKFPGLVRAQPRAGKVKSYNSKSKVSGLKLKVPGQHNLSNAAAALTVARLLEISDEISIKTLNNFSGTWRRLEYKGEIHGAKIYDDYGHHPTEIKATLSGARELLTKNHKLKTNNRLWCVFQPHQYQRTYNLFDKFVGAFDEADETIILPIYSVAGREKEEIIKKVSSKMLAEKIGVGNQESGIKNRRINYIDSFEKAAEYLKKNLKAGDICLIMGAGDIYKLTERLFVKN